MDLGFVQIDILPLLEFLDQSTLAILWQLFIFGGYLFVVYAALMIGLDFYKDYRADKNTADWNWVVLAIDLPALNEQTPKAVEQLFAQLAGALEQPNVGDAFRGGFVPKHFSFEIISMEGYIQFLVYTEESLRDLVESSIYAQYPDAEIVEVEDYTKDLPDEFPNETHDMWAIDFGLTAGNAYPIRTYPMFEHNVSKDEPVKDPMGALLESFSRIGPGEQIWFQMMILPVSSGWKEEVIDEIKRVIGDNSTKNSKGNPMIDAVVDAPVKFLETAGDQIFNREAGSGGSDSKDDGGPPNNLSYLTPGQTKVVEGMELKISKPGFQTKIRAVYVARKEVFRPSRVAQGLIGAINQYNIPTANTLAPSYGVSGGYFFKEKKSRAKKNFMMKLYKKRKIKDGGSPFILNIEELATVWHFPMKSVKAPLVQTRQAKATEPPASLPVEALGGQTLGGAPEPPGTTTPPDTTSTQSSGYKTDAGDLVGYDADMKFG